MYDVITGGAAVSPETVRYFLSLDMKVLTEIIEDFRFLLFCLKLAEEQYSTDVMQLLEMTGMTETVGMVPITNLDEPGGFRIGKVRKILDFRILLKYVYIYTFCVKVGKVYPHYFEVKVKDRWTTDGLYGNDEEQDDNRIIPNKNVTVGYFWIFSIKTSPLCDKLPQ